MTGHIDGLAVDGNLVVNGGNGGAGGDYWKDNTVSGAIAGDGGKGGDASLAVTGTVQVGGSLSVQSGADGAGGGFQNWPFGPHTTTGTPGTGGDGGDVSFSAGTLSAPTIILTKQNGDLTFTVGTLDVSGRDTDITLSGNTVAGTGIGQVGITTVDVSNGRRLSLNNADGAIGITTLNVNGSGTLAVADSANATIGTLDASNTAVTFVAPANVGVNQTVVVATNAYLDNAVIDIDISGGIALSLGEKFKLVSATTLTATGINGTINRGRYIFDLNTNGSDLEATYADLLSFAQATANALAGTSYGNVNLDNGAAYLDQLENQLGAGNQLVRDLDNAFNAAIDHKLGAWERRVRLGQLEGEYAIYANTALSSDAARFRKRWQGQNRFFFDTRLFSDLLADGQGAEGLASGGAFASPVYGARDCVPAGQSRIWAGGFGSWAKQNERSNLPGYKYDSQGAVLGYEYTRGNLSLGFAAAYSRGDLKVNDLRYKNEADVLNLAIYGAYIHESGAYVEGGFGYGHAWNDYKVHSAATPGGVKKSKYGSNAFTTDLELGYIARLPQDFNLIPSVGIEYTYLRNSGWTESVNNPALIANRFDSGHDHGIDIPVGLRFNRMFRFGCDGGFVIPEIRAAYVYSANKSRPSITSGYASGPGGGAKMVGVDPGRSHWRIGAGLSGRVNSRVDFRLDYDFETRSGFKGHNLNASVGLSF